MKSTNSTRDVNVKARAKKRRSRLGAAMIEAVVVLPVLITCYGVTMYAGGARHKKLNVQQQARLEYFTFASEGCEGSLGSGPSLPSIQSETGDPGAASGELGSNTAAATTSGHNEFFTVSGDTAASWSWNKGFVSGTAALHGHSFYFCNEKTHTGVFAFFGYAIDVVQQLLPSNTPGNF